MGALDGRVAVVAGDGPLALTVTSALTSAGARFDGDPDVAVWASVGPDALLPCSVVGLGEPDWVRLCEQPLFAALEFLQGAYPHLKGRDGRVVLLCPSVALEGAAHLVQLAAAAEGQRQLAKSLARRWGRDGITVNVVTVPVAALGATVADAARTAPALGGDARAALDAAASTVVWLAGPGAGGITGTTIGADGGAVMAP
jgi:NAD(P)-dependent dehydrogenase (short-subunit alcohol dehydrogenase family)